MASSSFALYEEKPDFISQLPDPILCLIFTHLPVEELVRTSILSKRYISLYRFVPSLNFAPPRSLLVPKGQPNHPFLNGMAPDVHDILAAIATNLHVAYVLSNHATTLVSCKISHYIFDACFGILTNWLRILSEMRRVQELSLTCVSTRSLRGKANLRLQEGAFSFETLTSLDISNYIIEAERSSCFEGCRNLRKLRFQNLTISDDTLNQIITKCEDLESLILENFYPGLHLIIYSDKLRFFKIHGSQLLSLNLQCNALEWMQCDNIVYSASDPIRAFQFFVPNMSKLSFSYSSTNTIFDYCMCSTAIFGSLCNVIKDAPIPINGAANIKVSQLHVCLTHAKPALAFYHMLEECTHLEVLQITFMTINRYDIRGLPWPKERYWARMAECEGVENHLRLVELDSFMGNDLEIELIKFILSRATKLEKLVIYKSHKITRNGRMFLRSIGDFVETGASPNVTIRIV